MSLIFTVALGLAAVPAGAQSAPHAPAEPVPAGTAAGTAATPELQTDDHIPFMADTRAVTETEGPSAAGLLVRALGALLIIVGLIAAGGWGLRRLGATRSTGQRADAPDLAVLATVPLGDRRALAVVRFGERVLLIGSTSQSITLLATEEANRPEELRARSVADLLRTEAGSFDHELMMATKRGDWAESGEEV
jgi:flagellar biosynthetic protein FliO